jgi:hypothetical protein
MAPTWIRSPVVLRSMKTTLVWMLAIALFSSGAQGAEPSAGLMFSCVEFIKASAIGNDFVDIAERLVDLSSTASGNDQVVERELSDAAIIGFDMHAWLSDLAVAAALTASDKNGSLVQEILWRRSVYVMKRINSIRKNNVAALRSMPTAAVAKLGRSLDATLFELSSLAGTCSR